MPAAQNATSAGSIIVVEDDDDTRDALCQLLFGQGYDVVPAANGLEALQLLGELTPDLIITDLSMPTMTGWQLLERLSRDEQWHTIPVIVLSADKPPPLDYSCFLQKPVPPAELLGEIAAKVAVSLPKANMPAA